MKKRTLALALAICLAVGVIGVQPARAAGGGVKAKLDEIKAQYPHGSFFSVNGQMCKFSNASTHTCDNCRLNNILRAQGKETISLDAYTCVAFARYILVTLYGKNSITQMGEVSRGYTSSKSTFSNAKPGDLIYFVNTNNGANNTKDYGNVLHQAIVYERTNDGLWIYDSNVPYTPNKVHLGFVKYSDMSSWYPYTYSIVLHYVNYDTVDNSTSGNEDTGESTLAFSSMVAPSGRLKQGSYFGLAGTITSNYKIRLVEAFIHSYNDTSIIGAIADSYTQENINSRSFSIAYSALDDNLEINLLPPGKYVISYSARDTSGTSKTWSSEPFFIQGNAPCAQHIKGEYLFREAIHPHYRYFTCGVCGEKFTDGSTAPLETCSQCNPPQPDCSKGHTVGEYLFREAVHPHYQYFTCKVCGEKFTDGSTAPLETCSQCNPPQPDCSEGHTWSDWQVETEAACGKRGAQAHVCSVCGAEEIMVIPALEHDYQAVVEETRTVYTCVNCGDSYVEEKAAEEPGMVAFQDRENYTNGMFSDVQEQDWFSANVRTACMLSLMEGVGGGRFAPGNSVTLAQAVTMAARIHKIYHTGKDSFPRYDGGNWYDPYVDYAREQGIIYENYTYNRPATREEFCHILAAALPGAELMALSQKADFADQGDIVYQDDVALLRAAGIIDGVKENGRMYFKPWNTITRAQAAAIVTRMVKPDLRKG